MMRPGDSWNPRARRLDRPVRIHRPSDPRRRRWGTQPSDRRGHRGAVGARLLWPSSGTDLRRVFRGAVHRAAGHRARVAGLQGRSAADMTRLALKGLTASLESAVRVAEDGEQLFGLGDGFDLILRRFGEEWAVGDEDLHRQAARLT